MQHKHEKKLLDPIFKRINQLEKMITDQNKELSQMRKMAKPLNNQNSPSIGDRTMGR